MAHVIRVLVCALAFLLVAQTNQDNLQALLDEAGHGLWRSASQLDLDLELRPEDYPIRKIPEEIAPAPLYQRI